MANILVLGVDSDSVYEQASQAIVAGHNACVALSREAAFRKLLTGFVDTLMVDCALDTASQQGVFRAVRAACPSMPKVMAQGDTLPSIARRPPTKVLTKQKPRFDEPLMRAVAFCFGLSEGSRLGVPTSVEIACDGVTVVNGLTTALQDREAILEFIAPDDSDRLLGLTLLAPHVPAVARLHFPGGGVLRIEGTVEASITRRGVQSLKITATADTTREPADIERPETTIASAMLGPSLVSA